MKRTYASSIAAIVTIAAAACVTFAASAAESRVLRLAATVPPTASPLVTLTEAAAKVKAATNGALDIQIFPSSQLGGQREFTEGVSMGTIDMCLIANGALESFEPRWAAYSLPFIFNNADHVYAYWDSALNKKVLDDFRTQKGMRAMAMFTEGEFRTVWTTPKAIRKFEDFKGVKLRVPEIPIYIDIFNALGANATPMPFGDVYTGLQTNVVDGLELAATSIILNNLTEVLKYNTKTMHIASPMVVLVNEEVFQSLTPEQRKILTDAVNEASAKDRVNAENNAKNNDDVLKQRGIELIEFTPDDIQKIRAVIQPVIDKYTKGVFTGDYLDQIRALGK
jgi:tripartite ATP-independent transporter DctP family solute receptor